MKSEIEIENKIGDDAVNVQTIRDRERIENKELKNTELDNIRKKKRSFKKRNALFAFILLSLSVFTPVVASAEMLIPGGEVIGICVSTDGVCVMNTAEFTGDDGETSSPAADAGIFAGDVIISINGKSVNSADMLAKLTDEYGKSSMDVVYRRNGEENTVSVNAKRGEDGHFRLGLWIKDCESGIGTLTYVEPETHKFGALGHGICDMSGEIAKISDGDVLKAEVTSVQKGERGNPGELCGIFSQDINVIGDVDTNCEFGVFGTLNGESFDREALETAERFEVEEGEAVILSDLDGGGIREYSAEITKINKDESNSKGMIIRINDPELLEKTGGIVQGMSGSPIIQNNKIVGAVTHVFVNDPTRGYGIFIENMLAKAENTE